MLNLLVILILSCPFNIQEKQNYLKKQQNSHRLVYSLISFKLGMMTGIAKLYILISILITFTFIQGHSVWEIQNFNVHFLRNFAVDLDDIQYVATTC